MTALGVIGVLMGISIMALGNIKKRGTFASASGELLANLRRARSEAYGRGTDTVFIIDTVANRWWALEDVSGTFDMTAGLTVFNPSSPTAGNYNVLGMNTFPAGVTFSGASAGYGSALPAPYAGIPSFSGSLPSPPYAYCTFCSTGGSRTGWGAIRFEASGGALFTGTGTGVGQSFSIAGQQDSGTNVLTMGIVAKTGAAESFQVYR
jgi:hypothetical protein